MNLEKLKEEMPYKWRVQSYSKFKPQATCVAYIDSRDVQDRLDEVCGPERWQRDHKEIKGNLFAGIGIKIEDEWVWKWDCGTESREDKEKGESSDSFKRAAVLWGVGRFLYSTGIQRITANQVKTKDNYPYPVDASGNKIWDLTDHINNKSTKVPLDLITVDQKNMIAELAKSMPEEVKARARAIHTSGTRIQAAAIIKEMKKFNVNQAA